MEFLDTIRQVQSNWNPYKKWEVEQQKKEKQNEALRKKYPPTQKELENAKQYGRTIVDVINTMDKHSIDKSEDAMVMVGSCMQIVSIASIGLGTGLGSLLKHIPFVKNNNKLHQPFGLIGFMLGAATSSIVENIWGAQLQKEASRIARYQTREKDLKDSRNFVIYDEAQMGEAQKIARTLPEVKESKKDITLKQSLNPIETFSRAKKTTGELTKDYGNYEEWKKEYLKEEALKVEKFKNMHPPESELNKAEKDKDVMLNTIKKIETSSLNYLMNMSLALHFVNAAIFSGGILASAGIAKILSHLQNKNILPKESTGLNTTKMLLPIVLPVALMISLMGSYAKLSKDSARVGRFKAKQDLLNNPENFIVYNEQQRKTVTGIEEPKIETKVFWTRFKEDIKSLKQLKKDYAEYKNYMNTKYKEELKLQESLKQVNISDKQKTDSIQLQKNAFHSFEKMDEKAQRFTDDTDAAVDTARSIATSIVATTCRIISLLSLNKKLMKHNKGKEPKGFEVFKLLKHLEGKEIATIIIPFILPSFISMPITIKGIQIKKDAGKIGIMTAMQDLDDPKNFLDDKRNF